MSVGAIGGAGGAGGAAGGAGGAGGVGAVGAAGAPSSVGDAGAKSTDTDTKAAEQAGAPMGSHGLYGPQMSTQDFCALRTQAATPTEEAQGVDLQKMLEWLMAIKLLEAANNGGE